MTGESKLPAGWRWIRFGDVVQQVKDRVDPETGCLDRFVAGEHMDTDDLRIRRWGEVGDGYLGPAFHMRFKPGHVLYGSRRTYLRKVAVADFEGVCANTTFVLESSTAELLPGFLPFVMTTEAFHEHSIKQSKGSVNPYINFRDIAWYEFVLPPTSTQMEIVTTLESALSAGERSMEAVAAAERLEAALIEDVTWDVASGDWRAPLVPVRELLLEPPRNGVSPPPGEGSLASLRSVSISAVRQGRFLTDSTSEKWCLPVPNSDRYQVRAGDAFAVRGNGNRELVGRVGLAERDPHPACVYPDLLIRLRFDPAKLDPVLATSIWNSPRVHARLLDRAKSSNGIYKVNGKDVASHHLPVPPEGERVQLASRLGAVQVAIASASDYRHQTVAMISRLREHLLRAVDS